MNNLYAICITALLLCQAGHAASDNEYTVRTFVSKLINLQLNDNFMQSIRTSNDTQIATIISNLTYLKDESKPPTHTLFSDLTNTTTFILYAFLTAQRAIDSMITVATIPELHQYPHKVPLFEEAITDHAGNQDDPCTYLELGDDNENSPLKNWLKTFKEKQKNQEISTVLDDVNREYDAHFDEYINNIIKIRESDKNTILRVKQELNGDNTGKDALPSLVDYFSASR